MRHMNSSPSAVARARLSVAYVLAQLLERLERSTVAVGAEQYRCVVRHLVDEFNDAPPGDELNRLLDTHPAAAQVYENLRYPHAGLCRSPLDASLATELRAREAIERAMRR
jgi:hypothetical protein